MISDSITIYCIEGSYLSEPGVETFRGNVFSGANSTTGGVADPRNNAESVFLPAGTSGDFTITVRAANIAGDGVPGNADTTDQDFALVIYNGVSAPPTQPTIDVNPASLSFTATAGGSNPASQTINITNTGAGTLDWTATDNAPRDDRCIVDNVVPC